MAFPAAFPGRCSAGQDNIEVGDLISGQDWGYSHVSCLETQEREASRPPAAVCSECFMQKPCPCDDGQ